MKLPHKIKDYDIQRLIYKRVNQLHLVKFKEKEFVLKRFYSRKSYTREVDTYKRLCHHPNTVISYTSFFDQGKFNMILEYVDGGMLTTELRELSEKGPGSTLNCLQYLLEITGVLGYLHQQGKVHRDIKTENIMVDKNKDIKLIDFDLSTKSGFSLDSILRADSHQPPEQTLFNFVHRPAADIYGLGYVAIILLYSSVGKYGLTKEEFEAKVPKSIGFDRTNLFKLIEDMTKKDWSERISSCDEVSERLEKCIEDMMKG
jgi:serine/threonine protein kinase